MTDFTVRQVWRSGSTYEPTYKCRDCRDGKGWLLLRCEGGDELALRDSDLPRRKCYRSHGHAPHTYAAPCGCRPMAKVEDAA